MKKHTKIYWIGIVLIVALCFGLVYYVFFFNTTKSDNPKLKIANNCSNKRGGEYELFSNGLIYSDPTINKLGKIVDSLNLKYKKCESKYDFTSISQTVGCIVLLEKRRVKQAKRDMMNNISFEDFIKKYPKAKFKKEVLILKTKYINFEDKEEVSFDYMDLQDYNAFHVESDDNYMFDKDLQNQWLFKYNKKDEYSDENIEAFYFPNKFKTVAIPDKYAQKIGYTDCMITPESAIYKTEQKDSLFRLPENWMELSKKEKAILLDRMRSTKVVGRCGMDTLPREHAIQIALLAAETANWDVFLIAHLNIMNDRFDRRSDNSISNTLRGTYLKELESLNINVTDLLLGSIFQISNPNSNHYFGNVSRIGRALSETKYRGQVEKAIFEVITDPSVDDYNRFLFYYLFDSYFGYSNENRDKKISVNKLTVAFKTLPKYFQENFVYKKGDEDF